MLMQPSPVPPGAPLVCVTLGVAVFSDCGLPYAAVWGG
jgi:hypothetical protein